MSAPSAPINIQATAFGSYLPNAAIVGVAMVTWEPGNAGESVTGYVVTCSTGATKTLTTPPGSQSPQLFATFTGLAEGVPVSFSVVAANADGSSPSSEQSNVVTPQRLPGSTVNVLSAIIGQMTNDYADAGYSPVPMFRIGEQFLDQNDSPPRIVFVIKQAKCEGGNHVGNAITQARQLWNRRVEVKAYVWGAEYATPDPQQDALANFGQAEQLTHNLAASVWRLFFGCSIEEADVTTDASNLNTTYGADMILNLTLELPVQDYQTQFVDLTQLVPTNEIIAPS